MLPRMLRAAVGRAHGTRHIASRAHFSRWRRQVVSLCRLDVQCNASRRFCTTTATSTWCTPTHGLCAHEDVSVMPTSQGRQTMGARSLPDSHAATCNASPTRSSYKDGNDMTKGNHDTNASTTTGGACAERHSSKSHDTQDSDRIHDSNEGPITKRRHARKLQIAVIGSGPSGCFVASTLTKHHPDLHIDMYESLPVPFGLIRYGVAPDHPSVKNVEQQFLALFQGGRVTWMGNMNVGRHMTLTMLLEHYAAVVVATGAPHSKSLHIPGEELGGVISVQDWVNYYNTMPFPLASPRFAPFDFTRVTRVAIIGNGNVALDATRVLSASYRYFAPTDMNCVAVKETMRHNRVSHIDIIGRRSAAHVACTIAEFRELTEFQPNKVRVGVDAFDLVHSLADVSSSRFTSFRAHSRLMELMHRFCVSPERMRAEQACQAADAHGQPLPPHTELLNLAVEASKANTVRMDAADVSAGGADNASGNVARAMPTTHKREQQHIPCEVRFRFHLQPIRILPCPHRQNCVGGILFKRTDVASGTACRAQDDSTRDSNGADAHTAGNVSNTCAHEKASEYCVLPCHLVITSLGYDALGRHSVSSNAQHGSSHSSGHHSSSSSLVNEQGLPLNAADGTIAHGAGGRVHGMPRVYCAGWASYGSQGVMAHALYNAQEVSAAVLQDWADGVWWSRSSKTGVQRAKESRSSDQKRQQTAGEDRKKCAVLGEPIHEPARKNNNSAAVEANRDATNTPKMNLAVMDVVNVDGGDGMTREQTCTTHTFDASSSSSSSHSSDDTALRATRGVTVCRDEKEPARCNSNSNNNSNNNSNSNSEHCRKSSDATHSDASARDTDGDVNEWDDTTTMLGKYGLLDYFVEKKLEPVSLAGLQRILHVERERGVDLGKRLEKMTSVRDMLDVALGGDIGKRTNDRVRGICPARPDAMLYLKELLDDETDLSALAHSLAKNVPLRLAEDHPQDPFFSSRL